MIIPDQYPDRSVCVIGLGYVGLTLAATMNHAPQLRLALLRYSLVLDLQMRQTAACMTAPS